MIETGKISRRESFLKDELSHARCCDLSAKGGISGYEDEIDKLRMAVRENSITKDTAAF